MPVTLRLLLVIAAGSAAGGVLRYLATHVVQHWTGFHFPIGTLVVNVTGCFAIGVLVALFGSGREHPNLLEMGLIVGLLGGFTTFSAFARETINLFVAGRAVAAIGYVLASNLVGFLAVIAGLRLAARG